MIKNVIVDLEATCWSENNSKEKISEIIEIGSILLDENLVIVDKFQRFVKPILNPILSDFCKKLTNIKQDDINSANEFKYVFNEFSIWTGLDIDYFCSWGNYDLNKFIEDCKLHDIEFPDKFVNTHLNVKIIFSKLRNIKKCGIINALKNIGLKFEGNLHRGIDDSYNIARIIQHVPDILIYKK